MADSSAPYPGPNEFSAAQEKAMRQARATRYMIANTPPGYPDKLLAEQAPDDLRRPSSDATDEQ